MSLWSNALVGGRYTDTSIIVLWLVILSLHAVASILARGGAAASALGEDITTIKSILLVVRSAEVADLAAKFRNVKHGVDRLRIILENQELINKL